VSYMRATYRVSERRACGVTWMAASTFRYQSLRDPQTGLRLRMREIAQARVRYGYRKIRVPLNREGWKVGKKLVYRLYREEGLALRHKPGRKRRAATQRRERLQPTAPNQVWSLDFVADQLADGRRLRALTVMDVFTRESLAIEVGQRLRGEDVLGTLNQIRSRRGVPKLLHCDNGSEFTSQIMDLWGRNIQAGIDQCNDSEGEREGYEDRESPQPPLPSFNLFYLESDRCARAPDGMLGIVQKPSANTDNANALR
jgi:putative transposase